jgi:phosphatidylglycerophosphate synthase
MKYIRIESLPDLLCYARLLLVPVVLALALLALPFWTGIALLAGGLTDVLDGAIARRRNIVTAYGSRLDSIADTLMEISAAAALLLLRPDVFTGHPFILGAWIAVEASWIILGWIRFRRIADLHLYLTKAGGVLAYAFIVYTFVVGYSEAFFHATATVLIVSSLECLLLVIFARSVDENMKSIYHAYRAGRLF